MPELTPVHDYAKKILADHDCNEYTYGDDTVETVLSDLKAAYPAGMEYPYESVAQAIKDISKPRYVKPELGEDWFDFDDWGKWGITDFCPDAEERLRKALESGKTFNTGWHGCTKEIESMCIQKDAEHITISCSTSMDEVFEQEDLFSDFLTEEEMENLTDDLMEEIRDALMWGEFSENSEGDVQIPPDSDIETISRKAAGLMRECRDRLDDYFRECISTTLYIMYGESDETTRLVEERIAKDAPYRDKET